MSTPFKKADEKVRKEKGFEAVITTWDEQDKKKPQKPANDKKGK